LARARGSGPIWCMQPQELYEFVSASVVPVVLISACGLLCLAFYNRLASIVSRLRAFQRERLQEQEKYARDRLAYGLDAAALHRHRQLLEMLEVQTLRVSRRANLIRLTLLCLLGTIACLTVCSLAMGLCTVWPVAGYVALPLFVLGASLLLAAVLLAMVEMKAALEPVKLESQFVSRLSHEMEQVDQQVCGEYPV